jgi:hypothetical protein
MLLSNRRIAILHVFIAAMQACWLAALFVLLWPQPVSLWNAYLLMLGALLGWMLFLELLSRVADTPRYDALALVSLAAVSVALVRLALYGGGRPWDLGWIGAALRDTANWEGGLPPVIAMIGFNALLWQRASSATSRDLNFFSVGVTFRAGLLLLLLFGALASGLRGAPALGLLWLYLALGLAAVAVSRISEKASEAQSVGRLLPARRLIQTLLAVGAAIGVSWLVSLAYTEAGIRGFFRLFDPLWQVVRPLLIALVVFLGQLAEPLLLWLERVVTNMLRRGDPTAAPVAPAPPAQQGQNLLESLPRWPFDLARDAIVLILIVTAALGLLIFLLLYLDRVRKAGQRSEDEEEGLEGAAFGGGRLARALDGLRNAGRLIGRFGFGRDLLAAISVQNIYANLCRIGRQRGRARLPSQPPDAYLPVLAQIFPGEDERLRRITFAYMRVHYGAHPVSEEELAQLRGDYRVLLRQAEDGEQD